VAKIVKANADQCMREVLRFEVALYTDEAFWGTLLFGQRAGFTTRTMAACPVLRGFPSLFDVSDRFRWIRVIRFGLEGIPRCAHFLSRKDIVFLPSMGELLSPELQSLKCTLIQWNLSSRAGASWLLRQLSGG
jgi:hypothetical protein